MSLPILGMQQAPDPILVAANNAFTVRSQLIFRGWAGRTRLVHSVSNLAAQTNIQSIRTIHNVRDRAIDSVEIIIANRLHVYNAADLNSSLEGKNLVTKIQSLLQ